MEKLKEYFSLWLRGLLTLAIIAAILAFCGTIILIPYGVVASLFGVELTETDMLYIFAVAAAIFGVYKIGCMRENGDFEKKNT